MIRRLTLSASALALWAIVTAPATGQTTAPAEPAPPADLPTLAPGEKFPLPADPDALQLVTGSLAIRGVQGTPGAGPIIGAEVEVQLVHRGMLIDTLRGQLDEHGVVILEGFSVKIGVQPIARITRAGMTYQKVGDVMDAARPHQTLDITCYEPTETAPAWRIPMRHVMITRAPAGLRVTEVVVIDNPAEETWIGSPGSDEKRTTTSFALPSGATDVELNKGFHDWCCTSLRDGRLVNHLPLMPLRTELTFSYTVPVADGRAAIDIVAPAPIEQLMVIAPDGLHVDRAEGLTDAGTSDFGESRVQSWTARDVASGARAGLSLHLAGGSAGDEGDPIAGIKLITAVGAGLLLLAALAMFFRAKPSQDAA